MQKQKTKQAKKTTKQKSHSGGESINILKCLQN